MAIGFLSDLDDLAWASHADAIDRCRGAICVAVISRYFADRDGHELAVSRLEAACGFHDHRTLRGWVKKGNKPQPGSIALVRRATGGIVDLTAWVNHPLWELMQKVPPDLSRLLRLLEQRSAAVRKILLLEPDNAGRFSHHTPDRQTTLALRDLGGLEAFTAMLCLARRGESEENIPAHTLPSMCAFDMFPRLLVSEPLLQPHWESLVDCLQRVFWRRRYAGGLMLPLQIDRLVKNVTRVRANPRANFSYYSGKRLSPKQELAHRLEELEWERERVERERAGRSMVRAAERRFEATIKALVERLDEAGERAADP